MDSSDPVDGHADKHENRGADQGHGSDANPPAGKDEKQDDFVSRCMGDKVMNADYPKQEQRAAVCYQTWRDRHRNRAKAALNAFRVTVQDAIRAFR
jgi:hypothetical protein